MIGIRRDVENFSRRMKGEVSFMLREMQHLNNALENINFKLYNPRYYQPNEVWNEPRLKNQLSTGQEKIHSMIRRMAGSGTPKMSRTLSIS
ncbi:hypothetical protein U9M48_023609 [Paspalum notatum var. saurae]|uniref:Uncharacterized protein n=1 Tax=Paspalum notatum var. saurae TaxID=547442 RepID=A0AAQ3TL13_PASNO